MSHIMDNELTDARSVELTDALTATVIEEMNQNNFEGDHPLLNISDRILIELTISHLVDTGRIKIEEPEPIELHEEEEDDSEL